MKKLNDFGLSSGRLQQPESRWSDAEGSKTFQHLGDLVHAVVKDLEKKRQEDIRSPYFIIRHQPKNVKREVACVRLGREYRNADSELYYTKLTHKSTDPNYFVNQAVLAGIKDGTDSWDSYESTPWRYVSEPQILGLSPSLHIFYDRLVVLRVIFGFKGYVAISRSWVYDRLLRLVPEDFESLMGYILMRGKSIRTVVNWLGKVFKIGKAKMENWNYYRQRFENFLATIEFLSYQEHVLYAGVGAGRKMIEFEAEMAFRGKKRKERRKRLENIEIWKETLRVFERDNRVDVLNKSIRAFEHYYSIYLPFLTYYGVEYMDKFTQIHLHMYEYYTRFFQARPMKHKQSKKIVRLDTSPLRLAEDWLRYDNYITRASYLVAYTKELDAPPVVKKLLSYLYEGKEYKKVLARFVYKKLVRKFVQEENVEEVKGHERKGVAKDHPTRAGPESVLPESRTDKP